MPCRKESRVRGWGVEAVVSDGYQGSPLLRLVGGEGRSHLKGGNEPCRYLGKDRTCKGLENRTCEGERLGRKLLQ